MALTNDNNCCYSYGDLLAMMNGNNNNMFGNDLIGILFIMFIIGGGRFFGGGFGGWGYGGEATANGALTRAEMMDSFNFNQLDNAVRGMQQNMNDGFYAQNTALLQGLNGVTREIDNARFAQEQCCCQTQRAIDRNAYEAQKNTCDIITSGNMNTRDIIESQREGFQNLYNYMAQSRYEDALRENDSLRTQLQSANLALQNNAQTRTIIDTLRPCPVPAYPSCSPYAVTTWGNGNCCNNNNNCCY